MLANDLTLMLYKGGEVSLSWHFRLLFFLAFSLLWLFTMLRYFCAEAGSPPSSSLSILVSVLVCIESIRELEVGVFDLQELSIFVGYSCAFSGNA